MKFSLRREKTREYEAFFERFLKDVQALNERTSNALNEVLRQTEYEKLQKLLSGMIDGYMELIVDNIEDNIFARWQESDASLCAFVRKYEAGDIADGNCRGIEQHLGETMHGMLKIEKAENIPVAQPDIDGEKIDRLKEICRKAQSEIQDIKVKYLSEMEKREEENAIYDTLRPLIEGIAESMKSFFEASCQEFDRLQEFIVEKTEELRRIHEENASGHSGINETGDVPPLNSGNTGSAAEAATSSQTGNGTIEEETSDDDEGENANGKEDAEGSLESGSGSSSDNASESSSEGVTDTSAGKEDDKSKGTVSDKMKKVGKWTLDAAKKYAPPLMRTVAAGLPDIIKATPLGLTPFGSAATGISKMLNTLAEEIDKGTKEEAQKKESDRDESEKKEAMASDKGGKAQGDAAKKVEIATQLATGVLNAMGIPIGKNDESEIDSQMKEHSQDMLTGLLKWLYDDDEDLGELFGVLGFDIGEIKDAFPADSPYLSRGNNQIPNLSGGNNQIPNWTGNNAGIARESADTQQFKKNLAETVSILGTTDPILARAVSQAVPNIIQGNGQGSSGLDIFRGFNDDFGGIVSGGSGNVQDKRDASKKIVDMVMGNDHYRRMLGFDGDVVRNSPLCNDYRRKHRITEPDYPERPVPYVAVQQRAGHPRTMDNAGMHVDKNRLNQACAFCSEPYDAGLLQTELADLAEYDAKNDLNGYCILPADSQLSKMAKQIRREARENGLPEIFSEKDGRYNANEMKMIRNEVERELSEPNGPNFSRAAHNAIRRDCGYPRKNSENAIVIEEIRELIPVLDDGEDEFIIGEDRINKIIVAVFRFNMLDYAAEEKKKVLDEAQTYSAGPDLFDVVFSVITIVPTMIFSVFDAIGGSVSTGGLNFSEDQGLDAYKYLVSEIGYDRTEKFLREYIVKNGKCRHR